MLRDWTISISNPQTWIQRSKQKTIFTTLSARDGYLFFFFFWKGGARQDNFNHFFSLLLGSFSSAEIHSKQILLLFILSWNIHKILNCYYVQDIRAGTIENFKTKQTHSWRPQNPIREMRHVYEYLKFYPKGIHYDIWSQTKHILKLQRKGIASECEKQKVLLDEVAFETDLHSAIQQRLIFSAYYVQNSV